MDLQVVVFSCLFYNYNSYLAQNSSFFVFFVFFFFFFFLAVLLRSKVCF